MLLKKVDILIVGVPAGRGARFVEKLFNTLFKLLIGRGFIWLDEHEEYGLPEKKRN